MTRQEYDPEPETDEERALAWLLGAYTMANLAYYTGLSMSTLYRMRNGGRATQRTWDKLKPIIDALARDEAEEANAFGVFGG